MFGRPLMIPPRWRPHIAEPSWLGAKKATGDADGFGRHLNSGQDGRFFLARTTRGLPCDPQKVARVHTRNHELGFEIL